MISKKLEFEMTGVKFEVLDARNFGLRALMDQNPSGSSSRLLLLLLANS